MLLAVVGLLLLPPASGTLPHPTPGAPVGTPDWTAVTRADSPVHVGPFTLFPGQHTAVSPLVAYLAARAPSNAEPSNESLGLLRGGPHSQAPIRPSNPTGARDPESMPPPNFGPYSGVNGTVRDSVTGRPVANALVTLTPQPAGTCAPYLCPETLTNATGEFDLLGNPGLSLMEVNATHYLTNQTFEIVPNGSILDLGDLRLVHDAFVVGRLVGSDPTHEAPPAGEVQLFATSRDGTLGGTLTGYDNATGNFTMEVPPVPDILTAEGSNPDGPYLENATFVDPNPNATIDIGDLVVPRGTAVHVELIDAVTGTPIVEPNYAALWACELDTDACPYSVVHDNASVYAVPGPTRLRVIVPGYVSNDTVIGDVPALGPRSRWVVSVDLEPDAVVVFQTNVTGGIPPGTVRGVGYVSACSLDALPHGYRNFNVTSNLSPFALTGACSSPSPFWNFYTDFTPNQMVFVPPMRSQLTFQSHGGFIPYFSNVSYLNTTPGEVVDIGTINYTPGGNIEGRVFVAGTQVAPPGGFEVRACSTDELGWCGIFVPGGAGCGGPDSGPAAFCAPTPPGPVVLDVTAYQQGSNRTWAEVPFRCCNLGPLYVSLRNVTPDHEQTINISTAGFGNVFGTVMARPLGLPPGPAAGIPVTICYQAPVANGIGCTAALTNRTGQFSAATTQGWYSVEAAASRFDGNTTWVDVTANNSTGVIWLQPNAEAIGVAVDPSGNPIPGAAVQLCPVSYPTQCAPLGSGDTLSGGVFLGTHAAGPFPGDAFRIVVSETGYSDGSAWANLTSGAITDVGRVVLVPTGSGGRPLAPAGSGTTWVDGSVADNRTGIRTSGYSIQFCPLFGGTGCLPFPDSPVSVGGEFNGSFPNGPGYLYLSEIGFAPAQFYLNLSGGAVHLGVLGLDPYPRLQGRLVFGPWSTWTGNYGLGPSGAALQSCDATGTVCGSSEFPDSGGYFNLSAPEGASDTLSVYTPGVSTPSGAAGPGMTDFSGAVAVPPNGTTLDESLASAPALELYAELQGRIGDGTTYSSQLHAPTLPVRYGPVEVRQGSTTSVISNTSGDGNYTMFAPSGARVSVVAGGSAYLPGVRTVTAPAGAHDLLEPWLDLIHYGWVTARALDRTTGAGLAAAGVSATLVNASGNITSLGTANAVGFVNMTSPPGSPVRIIATVPGYGSVSANVTVTASTTTPASLSKMSGSSTSYWVTSAEVNTVGRFPTVTVADSRTHAPIPFAATFIANDLGQPAVPPVSTNELGQFLVDGLVAANESFSVEKPGYSPNATILPSHGAVLRLRYFNLTPDGVIAGSVFDGATGLPVDEVLATACLTVFPYTCRSVTTNASGDYWLGVLAGTLVVSFQAPGYDPNSSIAAAVCSGCFDPLGPVPLWRTSDIRGVIVANPTDAPVDGATVQLCVMGSLLNAYCGEPVITDPTGAFDFQAPAGSYWLNITAGGFAPFDLSLDVGIGEAIDLGDIYLFQNGSLAGAVLSAATGAPIANASVAACPAASGVPCVTTTTNGVGLFALALQPGGATITASAPGYLATTVRAAALTASTVEVPPIYLDYLGPGQSFTVSGLVETRLSTNLTVPQDGALVQALAGSTPTASTLTGRTGAFSLTVGWGSYTLRVTAPGRSSLAVPIDVQRPLTGLRFVLDEFSWPLEGRLLNPATGAGLAGESIGLGGLTLATSDRLGAFTVSLPNGSYELSVHGADPAFANSTFPYVLAGPPAPLSLVVPLATSQLIVGVVDAATAAPIGGASVTLSGMLEAGGNRSASSTTDPSGGAAFGLPLGQFEFNVSAPGHSSVSGSVRVGATPVALEVRLNQTVGPAPTRFPTLVLLPLGAGGVAVGVVLLVWSRRRRRGAGGPEGAGPDDPEPGGAETYPEAGTALEWPTAEGEMP